MDDKKLSPGFEDYLEAIYIIKKNKGIVRVKGIAHYLKISFPSVTEAIRKLAKKKLVVYEKYGYIDLTKKGESIAKTVYSKHKILLKFLTKVLDIDKESAFYEACIMEHGLSKKTMNKLINFVNSYLKLKNKVILKGK